MVNVKHINDERLGRWKTKMVRQHSTPVLLLGVGHDHKSSELLLLVTDERTDEEIEAFLKYALEQIQQQIANKN